MQNKKVKVLSSTQRIHTVALISVSIAFSQARNTMDTIGQGSPKFLNPGHIVDIQNLGGPQAQEIQFSRIVLERFVLVPNFFYVGRIADLDGPYPARGLNFGDPC